jgi:hypothetical protein
VLNSQTRCTVQLASRWPKQAFAHTGCLNRSGQCCAFSMPVGLVVKWFSGLSFCGGRALPGQAGRCQQAACVAGAGDLRCASACAGPDCRRGVWGVGAVIPSACIASPLLTEVFSPYAAHGRVHGQLPAPLCLQCSLRASARPPDNFDMDFQAGHCWLPGCLPGRLAICTSSLRAGQVVRQGHTPAPTVDLPGRRLRGAPVGQSSAHQAGCRYMRPSQET